jgi:micrococcal nuclease
MCGCAGHSTTATDGKATVVRVIDGDTIVVRIGSRDENVRLLGIDTPETH